MTNRIKRPDAQVAMMNFIGRENNTIHFQYEKEMLQYQLMKAGDDGAAEESHRMMLQGARNSKLADDPLTQMRYLFICNTSLMTRFAIEGGLDSETAYNTSDLYIYNMNKCISVEEVLDLHYEMVSYFTKCMQNLKKENIISRHVSRCMDYIDQHLHEKILLDQLAAHVELNTSYLSVLFKKETGLSVSEYILRRRLEIAENMLKNSNYSCSEISNFLAFGSQSHFTEAFHKKNGITPKQFRDREYKHQISH